MLVLYNVVSAITGKIIYEDLEAKEVAELLDVSPDRVCHYVSKSMPIRNQLIIERSESDLAFWVGKVVTSDSGWKKEDVRRWLEIQKMFGVKTVRA